MYSCCPSKYKYYFFLLWLSRRYPRSNLIILSVALYVLYLIILSYIYLKGIAIFSDIPFEFHFNIPTILATINELFMYSYAQAYVYILYIHLYHKICAIHYSLTSCNCYLSRCAHTYVQTCIYIYNWICICTRIFFLVTVPCIAAPFSVVASPSSSSGVVYCDS